MALNPVARRSIQGLGMLAIGLVIAAMAYAIAIGLTNYERIGV